MSGAPRLHSRDVDGAAKVAAVCRLGQPCGMTGSFAGVATIGFGAVVLAILVACIGIKQFIAIEALTLSRASHSRS